MKLHPGLPWKKAKVEKKMRRRKLFSPLKFKKATTKMLHLEHSLVRYETWTLRKLYQKYQESFAIWWWKTMDRVKEERNILHTIRRKSNWIGYSLRRNCLLNHVID